MSQVFLTELTKPSSLPADKPPAFCFHYLIYSLKHRNIRNAATLPPLHNEGEPRGDEEVTSHFMTLRPDSWDTPLTHPDLILSVDRSYCRHEQGNLQAGYTIAIQYELLSNMNYPIWTTQPNGQSSVPLPRLASHQDKLLIFVLMASNFFGIVHDLGMLWKQRSSLTSSGTPVKNG